MPEVWQSNQRASLLVGDLTSTSRAEDAVSALPISGGCWTKNEDPQKDVRSANLSRLKKGRISISPSPGRASVISRSPGRNSVLHHVVEGVDLHQTESMDDSAHVVAARRNSAMVTGVIIPKMPSGGSSNQWRRRFSKASSQSSSLSAKPRIPQMPLNKSGSPKFSKQNTQSFPLTNRSEIPADSSNSRKVAASVGTQAFRGKTGADSEIVGEHTPKAAKPETPSTEAGESRPGTSTSPTTPSLPANSRPGTSLGFTKTGQGGDVASRPSTSLGICSVMSPQAPPDHEVVPTPESKIELQDLLCNAGIEVDSWRAEGSISPLGALMAELRQGEAQLVLTKERTLVRLKRVVHLQFRTAGRILIETHRQEHHGTGIRMRRRLPQVRQHVNETWRGAALRRVMQLGLPVAAKQLLRLRCTETATSKKENPKTYPGLATLIESTNVVVYVESTMPCVQGFLGLPEGKPFVTSEQYRTSMKNHYWAWWGLATWHARQQGPLDSLPPGLLFPSTPAKLLEQLLGPEPVHARLIRDLSVGEQRQLPAILAFVREAHIGDLELVSCFPGKVRHHDEAAGSTKLEALKHDSFVQKNGKGFQLKGSSAIRLEARRWCGSYPEFADIGVSLIVTLQDAALAAHDWAAMTAGAALQELDSIANQDIAQDIGNVLPHSLRRTVGSEGPLQKLRDQPCGRSNLDIFHLLRVPDWAQEVTDNIAPRDSSPGSNMHASLLKADKEALHEALMVLASFATEVCKGPKNYKWRPKLVLSHGNLSAASILADVLGNIWIIDYAHVGPQLPFADLASLSTGLLFDCCQLPTPVQELAQLVQEMHKEDSEEAAKTLSQWLAIPPKQARKLWTAIRPALAHSTHVEEALLQVLGNFSTEKGGRFSMGHSTNSSSAQSTVPAWQVALRRLRAGVVMPSEGASDSLDRISEAFSEAFVTQIEAEGTISSEFPMQVAQGAPPALRSRLMLAWDIQAMVWREALNQGSTSDATSNDFSKVHTQGTMQADSPILGILLTLCRETLQYTKRTDISPWQVRWATKHAALLAHAASRCLTNTKSSVKSGPSLRKPEKHEKLDFAPGHVVLVQQPEVDQTALDLARKWMTKAFFRNPFKDADNLKVLKQASDKGLKGGKAMAAKTFIKTATESRPVVLDVDAAALHRSHYGFVAGKVATCWTARIGGHQPVSANLLDPVNGWQRVRYSYDGVPPPELELLGWPCSMCTGIDPEWWSFWKYGASLISMAALGPPHKTKPVKQNDSGLLGTIVRCRQCQSGHQTRGSLRPGKNKLRGSRRLSMNSGAGESALARRLSDIGVNYTDIGEIVLVGDGPQILQWSTNQFQDAEGVHCVVRWDRTGQVSCHSLSSSQEDDLVLEHIQPFAVRQRHANDLNIESMDRPVLLAAVQKVTSADGNFVVCEPDNEETDSAIDWADFVINGKRFGTASLVRKEKVGPRRVDLYLEESHLWVTGSSEIQELAKNRLYFEKASVEVSLKVELETVDVLTLPPGMRVTLSPTVTGEDAHREATVVGLQSDGLQTVQLDGGGMIAFDPDKSNHSPGAVFRYAPGQNLSVYIASSSGDRPGWVDMVVVETRAGNCHVMSDGCSSRIVDLNFFNHAPMWLSSEKFQWESLEYRHYLQTEAGNVQDMFTGRLDDALSLPVHLKCVPQEQTRAPTPSESGMPQPGRGIASPESSCHSFPSRLEMEGAESENAWSALLQCASPSLRRHEGMHSAPCFLITGSAGGGKSVLARRLTTAILRRGNEFCPILVTARDLGHSIVQKHQHCADPLVTHIVKVHGAGQRQQFLRQALYSRCVVVVVDGLDWAGSERRSVEQYLIALATSGQRVVLTSRPTGCDVARLIEAGFQHLTLSELAPEAFRLLVEARLGRGAEANQLLAQVERDAELLASPLKCQAVMAYVEAYGAEDGLPPLYEVFSRVVQVVGSRIMKQTETSSQAFLIHQRSSVDMVSTLLQRFAFELQIRGCEVLPAQETRNLFSDMSDRLKQTWSAIEMSLSENRISLLSVQGALDAPMYGFAHHTIQEMLASIYIANSLHETESCPGLPPFSDLVLDRAWTSCLSSLFSRTWLNLALKLNHLGKTVSFKERNAESLRVSALLKNAHALTGLDLSNSFMMPDEATTSAIFEAIGHNGRLETLVLNTTSFGPRAANCLAKVFIDGGFQELQFLDLGTNHMGIDGAYNLAQGLSCTHTLTVLNLDENGLGDVGIEILMSALHHNLAELSIKDNHIGAHGALVLAEMLLYKRFRLHRLDISFNPLGDEGVGHLARVISGSAYLRELVLLSCHVHFSGAEAIAQALQKHRSKVPPLEHLNLGRNPLSDHGLELLAKAFSKESKLRTLDLFDVAITAVGMGTFAQIVTDAGGSSLASLSLAQNSLGDVGSKHLSTFLGVCPKLRTLDVSNFGIRDCLSDCVDVLGSNGPRLETLNLRGQDFMKGNGASHVFTLLFSEGAGERLLNLNIANCGLGDHGIGIVADALSSNHVLLEIDVSSNLILSAGAKSFGEALQDNTTLEKVTFQDNFVESFGAAFLASSLKENDTLHEIDLRYSRLEKHAALFEEGVTAKVLL